MSSMTEDDGMSSRCGQAEDAPTIDRTSACGRDTEVSTRGKRRRWTAEQKCRIVAESMEPGVSAAMVASRHGISSGQFYAWRQQLLLRGALGAGADTTPGLVGVDVMTADPCLEGAVSALPESGSPTTMPAPVLPAEPDGRVGMTLPESVSGRADEVLGRYADIGIRRTMPTSGLCRPRPGNRPQRRRSVRRCRHNHDD